MELFGESNHRQVFYLNIHRDGEWFSKLPDEKWIVFTISDEKDIQLISMIVDKCLNKNVGYICCAGKTCELTHDIFDEELVARAIGIENRTGVEYDYEDSPNTTWHNNFSEGFWFSIVSAYDGDKEFNKVVCLDSTVKGVRKHIRNLLAKINSSWLPSDEKFEEPVYD
jgi:hypothetical protein